ncbi:MULTISPECIES: sn-glycerol-3-phosphate import ATP-binding protein UgpC [unclassified Sinorhizobium]|uniref:sn-glycerol-3-phosphate import ATP-binding protein UgpC n=1 Tax=unclassified Sinorhizobium TaxID=2613772 RepID=UPI0024C2C22B|nr:MULTISPECIES: sn-glycerol-3-phosphate import ATP-binding protein UgpC [unclassified Sinorhizobium]MDK1373813.1 sn-glycerol-3-phosphate import ATP-binding protein UgpC [Sinorhizobium sp. 6-70]MDK1481774.1 sn-glycerol-3-phosphate import ATP-binding protein UgpC [Sinorhizobium sp. 6-117]
MAEIILKDIRKTYAGAVEAIQGVSLEIKDGELVVLVGPSGCGKSTLLRMIAGLEGITSGEILIGDRRVNELDPAERDIAMVFQNYALYPHMTVRQNLAYGLKNRKTPKDEIERRIAKAAKTLEIEPYLDRKPRQLSGGQRQRVAMGRAIVREPAAFLFDEPLSNLDAKLRGQMRIEIKRLQRSLGTTSVYVTHDQMEAMTLADKLVVVNAGRIEQVGTPIELYEKPATVFVATFIGSPSMNLLGGDSATDGWSLAPNFPRPSGSFTIGVRPEDLTVVAEHAGVGDFEATVRVDGIELVGAESLLHGRLASGHDLVFRVSGRAAFQIGDEVKVAAGRETLHLFDAQGRRATLGS